MAADTGFGNGYITLRNRKLPIVWVGQFAQHIASNHQQDPKGHPLLHVRIQQLAKAAKEWQKKGAKRYISIVADGPGGDVFAVVIDVHSKFVSIVTAYKTKI